MYTRIYNSYAPTINNMERSVLRSDNSEAKRTETADTFDRPATLEISERGRKQLESEKISNQSVVSVKDNKVRVSDAYKKDLQKAADKFWVEEDGTVRASMKASKAERFFSSYDKDVRQDLNFWIRLTRDPTFLSEEYSVDDVRGRLAKAGVQTGFFDMSYGDHTTTQFLTQGKNAVAVYSKEQYDQRYSNLITNGGISRNYKSGDIFRIGGKEYIVDDKGKLDVPYGEDIWDVEYPKTKEEETKEE